jgi:hypothetical protein
LTAASIDFLPLLAGIFQKTHRRARSFFAPLARLEPQGALVYLGAIHNMGTFAQRLAVARKYPTEFGLGAYCGFGRLPPSELPGVLADHPEAVEIAAS